MNTFEQPSHSEPGHEDEEVMEAIVFDESPVSNLISQEAEVASKKAEGASEHGKKLRRLVGVMAIATSSAINLGIGAGIGSSLERKQHNKEPQRISADWAPPHYSDEYAPPRNAFEEELWKEIDLIKKTIDNPQEGVDEAKGIVNDRISKVVRFLSGKD